jgi:arsenate reductase-like glutaredoxin family protein
MFQPAHILRFRNQHPDGLVIAHPECSFEVCRQSDFVGSTEHIVRTIKEAAPNTRWLVGTELNLVNRLAEEVRHEGKIVQFMAPTVCMCSTMQRIDPQHLAWTLENLADGKVVNQIWVSSRALSVGIYGIRNCDSMKKAFVWLAEHAVACDFVDYRQAAPTAAQRRLEPPRRLCSTRAADLAARRGRPCRRRRMLMARHPSLIRRPVIDTGTALLVGFDPDRYRTVGKRTMTMPRFASFLFDDLDIRGAVVASVRRGGAMIENRAYPAAGCPAAGEMSATTVLLGGKLKQPGRLTIQMRGNGPSLLVIDCNEQLQIRGMARCEQPQPEGQSLRELLGHGHLQLSLDMRVDA